MSTEIEELILKARIIYRKQEGQFVDAVVSGLCQQLRDNGWMVTSHNDYPTQSGRMTCWSFSRGNQFIDASGKDDVEALIGCSLVAKRLSK